MSVVIIGAGQAGFQAAASLRAEGYQESITLVGDEPHLPYQRPPLSKGMLLGKQEARHAVLRPESFYQAHSIDLVTNDRAVAVDTYARRITLASGAKLAYGRLVLATGARNRTLPVENAFYLRTLDECAELQQRLSEARYVAIIGGGFIGLEVAAAACTLGKFVSVVEVQSRLLARVVAPVVSEYFRDQHAARGIEIMLNRGLAGVPGADLVVAGVGVVPNVELALDAGLPTGNGIVVDEFLRTADPHIFAIGDCAEYPNAFAQARVRLESVQNAVDQAASVARTITGRSAPYASAPWFWSDQFDIRLQIAGLAMNYDQVTVRGETSSRKFSVFYYRAGSLIAVDSINRPAEHLAARKIIAACRSISPEQAADESFDLKSAVS